MKKLAISLLVWVVVLSGVLLLTGSRPQKPRTDIKRIPSSNAAQELRVLHEHIVRATILYF